MNEKLSEILQRAVENEPENTGFYQELEYTQIDQDYLENLIEQKRKKKKGRSLRRINIAAIILAFFVVSSAMVMVINEGAVSAVKGKLEKLVIREDHSLVLENEGLTKVSNVENKNVLIESWKDIGGARKMLPDLYIPNYIPETYEFQSLSINRNEKNKYWAAYQFKDDAGGILCINQYKMGASEDLRLTVNDYDEVIEAGLAEVYISYSNFDDAIMATYLLEGNKFDISGNLTLEELEKIVVNLGNKQ